MLQMRFHFLKSGNIKKKNSLTSLYEAVTASGYVNTGATSRLTSTGSLICPTNCSQRLGHTWWRTFPMPNQWSSGSQASWNQRVWLLEQRVRCVPVRVCARVHVCAHAHMCAPLALCQREKQNNTFLLPMLQRRLLGPSCSREDHLTAKTGKQMNS